MLRVLSDTVGSADAQKVTLLSLLDLSAASTIHCSYCDCSISLGFLRWLTSLLNGRTQQIAYAGLVSAMHSVFFSVP